jgi:hypothetical protein
MGFVIYYDKKHKIKFVVKYKPQVLLGGRDYGKYGRNNDV